MINPKNRKWWKKFELPSIEGLIPQYRGDVDERARAGRLRSGFAAYAKRLGPVIAERFGDREARLVVAEARVAFESLIPTIPFIGGRANPLTWNLETSAMFLALYRALERRGVSAPETGTLFARMIDRWLSSFPRILLRVGGLWRFSPWYLRSIRRRAKWSGGHTYPEDFVYDFVPAGPGFDWGVNYTECAIVKFYGAHGAGALVPFMCPIDFQLSRAFGLGLRRSQTIALGDPRCDFRFRRGGPTVDLSTRQPQRMPAASA